MHEQGTQGIFSLSRVPRACTVVPGMTNLANRWCASVWKEATVPLQNQRINVEGFTDNVPIGPELRNRFPSNWELSTARATDVVRYLAAQGVNPNILAAQGFGDTQPVASNDTAQGRAKNRRVEIVIMAAGS